jgi:hypothetical protein
MHFQNRRTIGQDTLHKKTGSRQLVAGTALPAGTLDHWPPLRRPVVCRWGSS